MIEYELRSSGKRFYHNIKIGKYTDPKAFGISVSHSGSFRDALTNEIDRIVDMIYANHVEYLPPERIPRTDIVNLVSMVMDFNQKRKSQQLSGWNELAKANPKNARNTSTPTTNSKSTIQSTLANSSSPPKPSPGGKFSRLSSNNSS